MLKIGILGGGQLARMMTEAAIPMGLSVSVLDPSMDCPASQVGATQVIGNFNDSNTVVDFGVHYDVVTCDIEHVSVDGLKVLERKGVNVQPSSTCLSIIQDKKLQKQHFSSHEIPVIPTLSLSQVEAEDIPVPKFYKRRRGGYDGKGVSVKPFEGTDSDNILVEPLLDIEKELACMVGVFPSGEITLFPVVETIQKDGICVKVICPASIPISVEHKAKQIAIRAAKSFHKSYGVYGVEMFLLKDGSVVMNEIAPRPHNSGHYTIEACHTSQFELHLRAITGMDMTNTDLKVSRAEMVNVIGTSLEDVRVKESGHIHWYGKKDVRSGRKMGHITYLPFPEHPVVAVIMGSSSDLPIMNEACDVLKRNDITVKKQIVSAHRDPEAMVRFAKEAERKGIKIIIAGAGGAAHLPGMVASLTTLPVIGVPVPTSYLGGQDSLYSIVQMPDGVPVATVGIGKAKNAGLLALRMLGISDSRIRGKSKSILIENLLKVESQNISLKR